MFQVPYAYDSLEPHFHNELRAYFNKRRRWTTRARYGYVDVDVDNLSQEHPSHVTVDLEPLLASNPNPNQSNVAVPTPLHQDFAHASLHSAILSLSINRGNITPTPANSPISSETPPNPNLNPNLHADPLLESNPNPNSNINMHATQEIQTNNSLHEMWVNGLGPFMTNGELREASRSSSTTESDSKTVVMFNLDRLNDNRPEWVRGAAWERGQIPESPDGSPNSLVNREERDKSRDVTGSVRHGPFIISNSGSAQYQDPFQNMQGLHTTDNLVQSVSLDTGLEAIRNSETYDTDSNHSSSDSARTDPGIQSGIQCDPELSVKCGPSKKRIGFELGRIGRNIRQKLFCGSFSKKG